MRRYGGSTSARLAVGLLAAAWTCACYTTLDPTILEHTGSTGGNGGSGGNGSTGGSGGSGGSGALPPCSFADSGTTQYVVCSSPLAYAQAALDCAARGATLAAIGNEAENQVVASIAFGVVETNVWLGGTRDENLVWTWPDGGVFWRGDRAGSVEPGAYARWQPGEPNNSSTVSSDPERCLAMTAAESDWNDRSCSVLAPYVCEISP
jgi:hypothetical protein